MSLTREQARVAAAAMRPRVRALEELLAQQVQLLPEGNSDWATTRDQLDIEHGALMALRNIAEGQ